MKFKEEYKERLEREYKEDLDKRLKIVLEDFEEKFYTPCQSELLITDITRTEEEQKQYYIKKFEETGKVPFTYHYKNADGITSAVDIRMSILNSSINEMIAYLVTIWKQFGLTTLAHDIEGYHLHIQCKPNDKKTVDDQVLAYLANALVEKDVKSYFIATPHISPAKSDLLASAHAMIVAKPFIAENSEVKEIIAQSLVVIIMAISDKIKYLKYIPSWLRKAIIGIIISSIMKSQLKKIGLNL